MDCTGGYDWSKEKVVGKDFLCEAVRCIYRQMQCVYVINRADVLVGQ